ncbi:response regulator transcription factor [Pseudotenacibaculum haliotis]|uniref:Response regulator transcription factor n=1 Tax=Pseudotenacibaculum haliotis TaxID=1862138 RepID=A0ABW5LRL1_9FLAO
MIVHQTDYLESLFEKPYDLFIQNWKKSPETSEVFKREMLKFVETYKKYRPAKALWLHQNFTLVLDKETQKWAEEHVVYPCVKYGNQKFAFVVSKDVFSHVSVVDSFEGLNIRLPKHFTSEKEALKWLIEDSDEETGKNVESSIYFEGLDEDGNMLLKVKTSSDATNLLKLFGKAQKEDVFYNTNLTKFTSLTNREKEILLKYASGISMEDIANYFNISIYTARTHWRNIKRKLAIDSSIEAVKFLSFF